MPKRHHQIADSDNNNNNLQTQPSTASSFGNGEPLQKRARTDSAMVTVFNTQFKVGSQTNEEVLGACPKTWML